MDFNMVQTTHLEEYGVPVSVLFVFLLLIHQRHRLLGPATPDFEDDQHRGGVRPSRRIQSAASVAAAAAAKIDELEADETAGSVESEGAFEYPPSPSDSLSSNAEPAGFSNDVVTRAGSLSPAAEEAIEAVGVRRSTSRSSPVGETSHEPGALRDLIRPIGRPGDFPSSSAGPRSATATSTGVRGKHLVSSSAPPVSRLGSRSFVTQAGLGSSSRGPQASAAAIQSALPAASSRSGQLLQPKVEPDDDHYFLDESVSMSTPLPPRRALTPRTPAKARGGRAFSPDDVLASDDGPPFSSPLPPKLSASVRISASRSTSTLYASSLSRGPSSAGSRASIAARGRTASPSSASTLRASPYLSRDATPPPSSVGSSASATLSRTRSGTLDRHWTPMSRMSSLSPTPSEVVERWVRKVSSRSLPSAEDAQDDTDRCIVTAWFESSSDALIDYPPDLRDHPDLQLGDLFYHYTPDDYQLWIWEVNDGGMLCWVRVKFMSVRNGMYLTLTPGERRPSWVSQKYANARKRELLRQGYEV